MSVAVLRAAIKTAVESVANVGLVHDYEPYLKSDAELRTFFQVTDAAALLGWTITRERTEERDAFTDLDMDSHLMVIRGYAAMQGQAASEKAFQDTIEAVRTRLRQERVNRFGGLFDVHPPNVRTVEAREYVGKGVHYCEITMACDEVVAVP